VTTAEELRNAVQKAGAGKEITLKVMRGDKGMDVKARLQEMSAPAGRPNLMPELPEGFQEFSGKLRPFFQDMNKVPALEKKIQELEKRIQELEKKTK
jgi:hypothetical protein